MAGPFPNDNRFAVRFNFDVTNKPSGRRMKMDEVGLFTVENGKITREEFFYPTEGWDDERPVSARTSDRPARRGPRPC